MPPEWLVQFFNTEEYQLRVGETKQDVMFKDELTGRPAVEAKPLEFFPQDRWSIQKRKKGGVVLASVTPKTKEGEQSCSQR